MADKPPFTPFTATGAVHLTVASPCSARWSEMTGDAQRRFCGKCHKYVYDLSATMGRIATIGIIRGVSTDPQKK